VQEAADQAEEAEEAAAEAAEAAAEAAEAGRRMLWVARCGVRVVDNAENRALGLVSSNFRPRVVELSAASMLRPVVDSIL
jgi:hypothetical protein